MHRSSKMRALPLLALLVLPLAACQTGPVNRSMDSVHQPVVSRTDYVFDVYPTPGGNLPTSEMDRLSGWFASIDLGYGDRVSIDRDGSMAAASAKDGVVELLNGYGLLLSDVAPATAGTVPAEPSALWSAARSQASPDAPTGAAPRNPTLLEARTPILAAP